MITLLFLLAVDAGVPDLLTLRQRCGAGDDEACMPLWDAARRPEAEEVHRAFLRDHEPPDRAEAACLQGSGYACAQIALRDRTVARRFFRLACAQSYWFACNNIAGEPLGKRIMLRMHLAGCEHGDARSCRDAADWMSTITPPAELWPKVEPLYSKACDGGDGAACYTLAGRAEGKRQLELLERGCDLRNPDACFEAGQQQKSAAKKARMWRFACEHGVRDACVKK